MTLLAGDPPERISLRPGTVAAIGEGTAFQVRNESDGDALLFVYGAPPVTGQAELLEEVD